MKVKYIKEYDIYFNEIKNFCKKSIDDSKNSTTKQNMDYITWQTNPSSFMNKIYIKKDFLILTFLYDKKKLVGISGIEAYNKDIALLGRRLFILKKYRKPGGGSFHDYMLKPQIEYITKNNFKVGIISFNEYKKILYNRIKNSKVEFSKVELPNYSDFIIIDNPVEFNFVKQYIVGVYTNKKYKQEKIIERWCNEL